MSQQGPRPLGETTIASITMQNWATCEGAGGSRREEASELGGESPCETGLEYLDNDANAGRLGGSSGYLRIQRTEYDRSGRRTVWAARVAGDGGRRDDTNLSAVLRDRIPIGDRDRRTRAAGLRWGTSPRTLGSSSRSVGAKLPLARPPFGAKGSESGRRRRR